MKQLMKCGHTANAIRHVDGKQLPVCVICFGINTGADVVDDNAPDLTGRLARCTYFGGNNRTSRNHGPIYPHGQEQSGKCSSTGMCNCEVPSDYDLPFFEYRGPGSVAETHCANCSFIAKVHPSRGGSGCYVNSSKPIQGLCEHRGLKFTPKVGGDKFDSYYCGCCGWD